MERLGPIYYIRPTPEEWEKMSKEEREKYLLLEKVDNIHDSIVTIKNIMIFYLVLSLIGVGLWFLLLFMPF